MVSPDLTHLRRKTHKKTIQGMFGLLDQTTIPYVPTHAPSRWRNEFTSPRMMMKQTAVTAMENQCDTFGREAGSRTYTEPRGKATSRQVMTWSMSVPSGIGVAMILGEWTRLELVERRSDQFRDGLIDRVEQSVHVAVL